MKKTLIALAAVLSLAACAPNYSEGFREGVVQKASQKGLIYKSFEGELVLEGLTSKARANGTSKITNVWAFSATDPAVMKDLDAAANAGKTVKLYYRQWFWAPPSQNTTYTVYKVVPIN